MQEARANVNACTPGSQPKEDGMVGEGMTFSAGAPCR